MRSVSSQALAVFLAVAVALLPTSAHASIFGEENAALTALVAQGAVQLTQISNAIATAKQQLELARDVYSGVSSFVNFDPQAFLNGQQGQWLANVPLASEVQSFVDDIRGNGLNGGHFDAATISARFDTYRDAFRRQEAARARPGMVGPYDARQALSISREAEAALNSPQSRLQLASRPEPSTVSEGLFASDAAKADPQLLSLYMQRRAQAKEAEYQAYKLYAESLGASPGKAQQLAAMAAGMTAQELARVDDKLGQSLSLQQLQQQQEAAAKAIERQENDALWQGMRKATEKNFKPPTRGEPTWESF